MVPAEQKPVLQSILLPLGNAIVYRIEDASKACTGPATWSQNWLIIFL